MLTYSSLGRPAFDCRGCALISFNRGSRSITVKYDHTLLHKTVGQLSELFPPPQRQLGPGAQKLLQQKTPKKSTSERKEKVPDSEKSKKTPSKKRQSQAGEENGQLPKKRRKKKQAEASAADHQDPPQANAPSWPEQISDHQSMQAQGDNAQSSSEYPSGHVSDSTAAQRGSSGKQPASQNGSSSTLLPFNVSPDEAARRLTVAKKLLSDAGVNPDSLSSEQMNIFSNQAPELQKDSIAMLAKYGAERLQIIPPQNKDQSKAADSTSASPAQAQSTQTAPGSGGPTTTKELSLQSGVDVNGETNEVPNASGSQGKGSSRSKRGLGKSRHACSECKSRKTKVRCELLTCHSLVGADLEIVSQRKAYLFCVPVVRPAMPVSSL